jgi:hypothetical protein
MTTFMNDQSKVMQNFIMRSRRTFLSVIIVLTFAVAAAGCSALRLGYASGDTFVYWWMDRYASFTDEQKPWVKEEIAKLFAWHRQTQLPDYAQLLAQAQQRLQHPVSATDVHGEFAVIQERAVRLIEHALPQLSMLALSLSPQQITHIERRFAANNQNYRKEFLHGSLEERQLARYKKVMKQAEYWFGDFTPAQKAQIRSASEARPLDYERWMAEREHRQVALIRLLRKIQAERPTREATAGMLHAYFMTSLTYFTYADNKSFFDASRDGMASMTADIINLATPAQKERATQRLQKLINDGYALAGKGAGPQLSLQRH